MTRKDYETAVSSDEIYHLPIGKTIPIVGNIDLTVIDRKGNKSTVITREPNNKYQSVTYAKNGKPYNPKEISDEEAQKLINQSRKK